PVGGLPPLSNAPPADDVPICPPAGPRPFQVLFRATPGSVASAARVTGALMSTFSGPPTFTLATFPNAFSPFTNPVDLTPPRTFTGYTNTGTVGSSVNAFFSPI